MCSTEWLQELEYRVACVYISIIAYANQDILAESWPRQASRALGIVHQLGVLNLDIVSRRGFKSFFGKSLYSKLSKLGTSETCCIGNAAVDWDTATQWFEWLPELA